jgi:hypothetical protein
VALLVAGACHALGYAFAALTSGPALRLLPATNIASAFVIVLGIFALLTPIADPARISVASQVGRLESGAVDPDKFDFNFLRSGSARFGTKALERLKTEARGPNATRIAERASRALANLSPYAATIDQASQPRATPATRRANIKTLPSDPGAFPADFFEQDWNASRDKSRPPACLTQAAPKCDAILSDLMADGTKGIILLFGSAGWIYTKDATGAWTAAGTLGNVFCSGVRDGLKDGKIELTPSRFKQVEVNGVVLPILSQCSR